jgi:hypothetical protein
MDASKAKKEASAEKQDRGVNEVFDHRRRSKSFRVDGYIHPRFHLSQA